MPPDPSFLYETVADAPVGDVGGGEPATGSVPEATPEPAPSAAPDYGAMLSSPEGQQYLQQAVMEAMQGYQPEYGEYEEPDQQGYDNPFTGLDPLDENFGAQLSAGLAQLFDQFGQGLMQQFQGMPALQAAEAQHHTAWAQNEFGAIGQELGAPVREDIQQLAITLAAGGRPPDDHPEAQWFDPGRALREATTGLTQLIQSERAAAVREYQEGLAGGNGAVEPPAGGTAAIHSEPVQTDMHQASLAFQRRNGWIEG